MPGDNSQNGFADRAKAITLAVTSRIKESLPGQVLQRFSEVDGGLYAKDIAYDALFAMFPLILAIISIVGYVLRDPSTMSAVQERIVSAFPPEAARAIAETLAGTSTAAGWFGLISLIGLLWSGSALFGAIERAFTHVYSARSRPFVKGKLIAFGMIFLFAILILLSVVASSLGGYAVSLIRQTPIGETPGLGLLATLISWLVSFGAGLLLFLAIDRIYPSSELTVRKILPGTLTSAVLFFLLSLLFPLYARFVANFNAFGALFGFFFLLLTWLYFVGQVVVLGAVLNAYLESSRHNRPASRSDQPRAA